MSGEGGESKFRDAGARPKSTPPEDRIVFKIELPKQFVLDNKGELRGNMTDQKDKLINKEKYIKN